MLPVARQTFGILGSEQPRSIDLLIDGSTFEGNSWSSVANQAPPADRAVIVRLKGPDGRPFYFIGSVHQPFQGADEVAWLPLPVRAFDASSSTSKELDRVSQSLHDLRFVLEASKIYEQAHIDESGQRLEGPRLEPTSVAFTIAIAVSYWRPFSENRDRDNRKERGKYLAHLVELLDEAGLEIHTEVGADRDRFFAHADARFAPAMLAEVEIDGHPGKRRASFHVPRQLPYEPAKVRRIAENARRFLGYLELRGRELQRALRSEREANTP